MSSLQAKVQATEEDIRAFAPLIAAQAEMRATMAHIVADISGMRIQVAHLEARIEAETNERKRQVELDRETRENDRKEREEGQERLRTERKSDRKYFLSTVIACAVFIVSAVAVIQGFAG